MKLLNGLLIMPVGVYPQASHPAATPEENPAPPFGRLPPLQQSESPLPSLVVSSWAILVQLFQR